MTIQTMPQFKNPRREKIHHKLQNLIGFGASDFYADICTILDNRESFHSATHLIGHLSREIESTIRKALLPLESNTGSIGGQQSDDVQEDNADSHRKQIESIAALLKVKDEEKVIWQRISGKFHKFAHRESQQPPREFSQEFATFFDEYERLLDHILNSVEDHFSLFIDRVMLLLSKNDPKEKDVKYLRNSVPNNRNVIGFFFENLNNEKWLDIKDFEKLFLHAPRIGEFVRWPASEYLSRMATKRPGTVAKIVSRVIPNTDNEIVHSDLIDAALRMVEAGFLADSYSIVSRERKWIGARSRINFRIPYSLSKLILCLTEKKATKSETLELLDVVLDIIPNQRKDGDTNSFFRLKAQSRFDSFHYRKIIEDTVPRVAQDFDIDVIRMLSSKLVKYIELSKKDEKEKYLEDFTCSWMQAIEEPSRRGTDDLGCILVSAIRDCCVEVINSRQLLFTDVISFLDERRSQIFERIILYLLSRFPQLSPELVVSRCKLHFDDVDYVHEYALLVNSALSNLPQIKDEIEMVFDLIRKGPNEADFAARFDRRDHREPNDEEKRKHREIWELNKLALFKKNLPPDLEKKYRLLKDIYGEPEHPDFAFYTSVGSWGPTSPIPIEDLKEMTVEGIVQYLRNWKTSGSFHEPTPEGLSRDLSSLAKNEVSRFSQNAEMFKDINPIYIRGILNGFSDALKDDGIESNTLHWTQILSLCEWVLAQPTEMKGGLKSAYDYEPDWTSTRMLVGELLEKGLESRSATIPIEYRYGIWELILRLCRDPSPSREEELRNEHSVFDGVMMSLNTVRGRAFHCVINYGLWLRKHFELQEELQALLSKGFDEMQEIRDILEKHLNTSKEPTITIRSVYGLRFLQLVLLDRVWTKANILSIFPLNEDKALYRQAAWEAYINYCNPYNEILDMLAEQYKVAVHELSGKKERSSLRDPNQNLGKHIVTFYWSGKIGLKDRMFIEFWERADDALRDSVISYVGWMLGGTEGEIEEPLLARFRDLWEFRNSAAEKADNKDNYKKEMAAFGWWFITRKFEDEWSLDRLYESLSISGKAEFDDDVLGILEELAGKYPEKALICLDLLVRGDENGWGILRWHGKAYKIMDSCIKGPDKEAAAKAKSLGNYLLSQGYIDKFKRLFES